MICISCARGPRVEDCQNCLELRSQDPRAKYERTLAEIKKRAKSPSVPVEVTKESTSCRDRRLAKRYAGDK